MFVRNLILFVIGVCNLAHEIRIRKIQNTPRNTEYEKKNPNYVKNFMYFFLTLHLPASEEKNKKKSQTQI